MLPMIFSVKLDDKVQLRQKVGMRTHYVSQIMLVAVRNIQVPKSFSDDVFHFGMVFFFFVSDGNHGRLFLYGGQRAEKRAVLG